MCAFCTSSEKHIEAKFCHVLKFAFRWRIVFWHVGIVNESKESVSVVLAIAHRCHQLLRRKQRGLDRVQPTFEVIRDGTNVSLSVLE